MSARSSALHSVCLQLSFIMWIEAIMLLRTLSGSRPSSLTQTVPETWNPQFERRPSDTEARVDDTVVFECALDDRSATQLNSWEW